MEFSARSGPRIGLVDDSPATRRGLEAILVEPGGARILGEGDRLAQLPLAGGPRGRRPLDLVLLDVLLRNGSRPGANVRALAAVGIPALIFSEDHPELLREASRAGAVGMIPKSSSPAAIRAAVAAAVAGAPVVSAEWRRALERPEGRDPVRLSPREAEVLALYTAGDTAERVGERLFISRETVLDHIRRSRAKFAAAGRPARTKVELYRRALEEGIIAAEGRD